MSDKKKVVAEIEKGLKETAKRDAVNETLNQFVRYDNGLDASFICQINGAIIARDSSQKKGRPLKGPQDAYYLTFASIAKPIMQQFEKLRPEQHAEESDITEHIGHPGVIRVELMPSSLHRLDLNGDTSLYVQRYLYVSPLAKDSGYFLVGVCFDRTDDEGRPIFNNESFEVGFYGILRKLRSILNVSASDFF